MYISREDILTKLELPFLTEDFGGNGFSTFIFKSEDQKVTFSDFYNLLAESNGLGQ